MFKRLLLIVCGLLKVSQPALAKDLQVGDEAPVFTAKTHEGKDFDLKSRQGTWTVLYFYPKADTPGCTKQACAFRDNIKHIRNLGADVFGISANTVEDQAAFHKKYHLNFNLLADPDGKIIALYGSKMPVVNMSKRWTFIIDPALKIRQIEKDVDPVKDSKQVAEVLSQLQKKP